MTSQKYFRVKSKLDISNTQTTIPVNKLKLFLLCQVALFLIYFATLSKDSLLPSTTFIASSNFTLGDSFSFHMKIELK